VRPVPTVLACVVALLVGTAGSAAADVVLAPDHTEAGAVDVTLTFRVRADDPADPVVGVRVQLPAARPLEGVEVRAPAGWTGTPTTTPTGAPAVEWAGSVGADPVDLVLQVGRMPQGAGPVRFRVTQTARSGAVTTWSDVSDVGAPQPAHGDLVLPFGTPVTTVPAAHHDHGSSAAVAVGGPATPAAATATLAGALGFAALVGAAAWVLGRRQRARFDRVRETAGHTAGGTAQDTCGDEGERFTPSG
jgi:hypothetical protein